MSATYSSLGWEPCKCTEDDHCSCCIYYRDMKWTEEEDEEWKSVKEDIHDYALRHEYFDTLQYAFLVGRKMK